MDLWIVPPHSHSAWFSHLDWYLNWQMSKGLDYRSQPPPAEVFRLAEEYGLPVESNPVAEKAPLMISAEHLVPARACVVLDYGGDLRDWLVRAKTLAFQMQAASVRVYLPAGTDRAKAAAAWDKLTGTCQAEFIEDTREQT